MLFLEGPISADLLFEPCVLPYFLGRVNHTPDHVGTKDIGVKSIMQLLRFIAKRFPILLTHGAKCVLNVVDYLVEYTSIPEPIVYPEQRSRISLVCQRYHIVADVNTQMQQIGGKLVQDPEIRPPKDDLRPI